MARIGLLPAQAFDQTETRCTIERSRVNAFCMNGCRHRDQERIYAMANGERIGVVTHYFGKISVAVIKLNMDLKTGERVHFLGRHTDFPQEITSMQIEHKTVDEAKAGTEVAVKVQQRVRRGDTVFRLADED
jgi:hypothetical protein